MRPDACPGRKSPVRPSTLLPMCRNCAKQDDDAKRKPPATHDGVTWLCEEQKEG